MKFECAQQGMFGLRNHAIAYDADAHDAMRWEARQN